MLNSKSHRLARGNCLPYTKPKFGFNANPLYIRFVFNAILSCADTDKEESIEKIRIEKSLFIYFIISLVINLYDCMLIF